MGHTSKVRIVGGGLSGVLAAFQAHALGARDIELHETYDELGGSRLPRTDHGLELRLGRTYFGPRGDAVRSLLEGYGLVFEDFENRFGSVSPSLDGDLTLAHDFAGPALRTRKLALTPQVGASLADRLRAYPHDIAAPLNRYCQHRLSTWLDEVHESAAAALGVEQVFPTGGDVVELAAARRACPSHAALYGIPRALCGRLDDTVASLPAGGFANFFAAARRELERLGVVIHTGRPFAPRHALAEHCPGDVLVWTPEPMALAPLVGLDPVNPLARPAVAYLLKARYSGPTPFHLRSFTSQGPVFGLYLYETRGQILLLAQCGAEIPEAALRREIHRLMSGFGGASLTLGEQVAADVGSKTYLTMDGDRTLAAIRSGLARRLGPGFVAGWGVSSQGRACDQMSVALAMAMDSEGRSVAA